jgi:hypothetical protein
VPEGAPWSWDEVEATVADYLAMLRKELRREKYSKAAHRRALLKRLDGRSEPAVEFKHPNISAVMNELGYPAIEGYKPRRNYQELIRDVVEEQVSQDHELQRLLELEVQRDAEVPEVDDILASWVDPPSPSEPAGASTVREAPPRDAKSRVNYLEREARNRSLGEAGELFVLRFEQARLTHAGQGTLASKIEHTSKVRGDAAGFDILSFEADSRERLIEVKTTGFAATTPFFVSRNQVEVSRRERDLYHLYRVHRFRADPQIFGLQGALPDVCRLEPTEYRASVG